MSERCDWAACREEATVEVRRPATDEGVMRSTGWLSPLLFMCAPHAEEFKTCGGEHRIYETIPAGESE